MLYYDIARERGSMFIDTGTLTGIMIALGASGLVHFIAYRRIVVLERQLWRVKRNLAGLS